MHSKISVSVDVCIIDRDGERARKMAEAFAASVVVARFWTEGDPPSCLKTSYEPRPRTCHLCLWHAGDFSDPLPDAPTGRLTVYYSGRRGHDDRMPADNERIQEPVHPGGEGSLTREEAAELLAYAEAIAEGRPAIIPAILKRPLTVSLLSSISILCQGYLAVHAGLGGQDVAVELPEEEAEDKSDVAEALKMMGWNALLKDAAASALLSQDLTVPERRKELQRKVRNAEWWSGVLEISPGLSRRSVATTKEEWQAGPAPKGCRWGWAEVEALFGSIADGLVRAGTVARAYMAVAAKLKALYE